nr:hypothetical protein [Tanacetum cinerariifolium]
GCEGEWRLRWWCSVVVVLCVARVVDRECTKLCTTEATYISLDHAREAGTVGTTWTSRTAGTTARDYFPRLRVAETTSSRDHGWDPSYQTWDNHDEPETLPSPVVHNTTQPQMSNMAACLNDHSYIPPNNEQNKPTKGDIGGTSNKPAQAQCIEFEELYASANKELYPGCDFMSHPQTGPGQNKCPMV